MLRTKSLSMPVHTQSGVSVICFFVNIEPLTSVAFPNSCRGYGNETCKTCLPDVCGKVLY